MKALLFGAGRLLDFGISDLWDSIKSFGYDILYFIPKVIYFLFASILQVIDLCQVLFRKLVGLDTYYVVGDGYQQSGDIIFTVFKNTFLGEGSYKAMNTAFWSITVLGLILLFVTTIAGLLRNEYTPDKEKLNSKSGVVKNALKAVASLVLIPLTCFFCLFLGNSIIVAVDRATQPDNSASVAVSEKVEGLSDWQLDDSGKTTPAAYALWGTCIPTTFTPISGMIFRASCYNANRIRIDTDFYQEVILNDKDLDEGHTRNFNAFNHADDGEHAATMIDEAFELNIKVTTPAKLQDVDVLGSNSGVWRAYNKIESFNRFNVGLVTYYYNLWHFDFIVGFAFAIFIGKLFLEVTLGLMQRIIEIMALLFFCPIVLAFMPVDNGEGFKKWRAHFITKTLSAYVTIISFNIFFIIYPLIRSIEFFEPGTVVNVVNNLISSIFVLAGLLSIKTINQMFATMFMIDKITANVMDQGAKAMEGVNDLAQKGVRATAAMAKLPLAPVAGAMRHGFAAGRVALQNRANERRERAVTEARNNSLHGDTRLGTMSQADRDREYGNFARDGEQQYTRDYFADQVAHDTSWNASSHTADENRAEAERREREFRRDANTDATLRDRIASFNDATRAGENRGTQIDQRRERNRNIGGGVASAAGAPIGAAWNMIRDIVGYKRGGGGGGGH